MSWTDDAGILELQGVFSAEQIRVLSYLENGVVPFRVSQHGIPVCGATFHPL